MAQLTYKIIENKKLWEQFALKEDPQTFLHSWNWGEAQRKLGDTVIRIGFFDGPKLIGVSMFITQDAKRGKHLIVPGGPLIDWHKKSLVEIFLMALEDIAQQKKALFVRVRPELLDTPDNNSLLASLGFVNAPMHLHAENTWVLDINKSDDELLYGMRKNTRYLIRKSQKEGLTFRKANSEEGIDILFKLQTQTVERHNFLGFPKKLFKSQLEAFSEDNQLDLFVCEKNGIACVAAMIIFYGDTAYYHHSGSTEIANTISASYFMQWNIIQEAKKRGLNHYNFWGIAPPNAAKHRFTGVTIFKKGFGGRAVDWMHAKDYKISNLYYGTKVFEYIRKKVRGL